jgi:hypothetical protein
MRSRRDQEESANAGEKPAVSPGRRPKYPPAAIVAPTRYEGLDPGRAPVVSEPRLSLAAVEARRVLAGLEAAGGRAPGLAAPTVRVLRRGLAAGCTHWLGENRLDWWQRFSDAEAASHAALSTAALTDDSTFACEFSPAIGATVDWESRRDGDDPHTLPGLGFRIVSRDPRCRPIVRELALAADPDGVPERRPAPHRAVVNAWVGEPGEAADAPRPSLFVVFDTPQRAVGLSYGFLAAENRQGAISAEGVELIAYDRDGRIVQRSRGDDLLTGRASRNAIDPQTAFARIGVRSGASSIVAAELRFGRERAHVDDDQGEFVQEPQVVYRVWHEPFPAAAVLQTEIEVEGRLDPASADQVVRLPFRCDSAAAFLRGFRAEFPDGPEGTLGLSGTQGLSLHLGSTTADREARISFRAVFRAAATAATEAPQFKAKAFVSVLAWDSREMELFDTTANVSMRETEATQADMEGVDLCRWTAASGQRLRTEGAGAPDCGPPSGGLSSLGFSFPRAAEIEDLQVEFGEPRPEGLIAGSLPRIAWPVTFVAESSRDSKVSWWAGCRGLAGPSVVAGPVFSSSKALRHGLRSEDPTEHVILVGDDGGQEASPPLPPRPPKEDPGHFFVTWTPEGTRADLALAVEADMAFAAVNNIWMEVDGPPQALDCEVLGVRYDGRTFQFKLGGGIRTFQDNLPPPLNWIGSGIPTEQRHRIAFFPVVTGVVRRRQTATPRLSTRPVRFDGVVEGTFAEIPAETGLLRNDGGAPVTVTGVQLAGPHRGDFYVLLAKTARRVRTDTLYFESLEASGNVVPLFDVDRILPLVIAPGETLVISANAYIQGPGERRAALELATNDPFNELVTIDIVAAPGEAAPAARVMPERIDFHPRAVGEQQMRRAFVESLGRTPLLVTGVTLASPSQAFSFVAPGYNPPAIYQVEPGDTWPPTDFRITFTPPAPGVFETSLNVQTNAGVLVLPLRGQGV